MVDSEDHYGAVGCGLATIADSGLVLDTWFQTLQLVSHVPATGTERLSARELADAWSDGGEPDRYDRHRAVTVVAVRTSIEDIRKPPIDVHDLYLRLHLLSHRLVRPHEANLDGALTIAPKVAWTSHGPCLPEQIEPLRWFHRNGGQPLQIKGIFQLPAMLDYVSPTQVQISDANRVWLGAYLAPGTIVTPEGFVGFNAGTLGPAMVEGRISSGVVVDEGSDIGGGASIMGTVSGGGKQVIRVGRNCLLGANSGIGISLGDGCVVEAGCYITAGVPVTLANGTVVKALELAGQDGLLFRRNARTGKIEALEAITSWTGLNPVLHQVNAP